MDKSEIRKVSMQLDVLVDYITEYFHAPDDMHYVDVLREVRSDLKEISDGLWEHIRKEEME